MIHFSDRKIIKTDHKVRKNIINFQKNVTFAEYVERLVFMVSELIRKNRSFRRFHQEVAVPEIDLREMVDNARLTASGRNAQTLRYVLSNTPDMNARIFPLLSWAGYLAGWGGPKEGERPSAYVVILNDDMVSKTYFCDHGIVSLAILLTAVEKGYGGCIIASVNRDDLREVLNIPEQYSIVQVIALGKPAESVVIEPMVDGDIKYWRDAQDVHHVPKRDLEDIIITFKEGVSKER
jgi:nitroreductase